MSTSHSESTILITGGTGFVGSHLIEALLQRTSAKIHATSYGSLPSIVDQLLPPEQIHQLNLTDAAATADLIKKLNPDQVYHLASIAVVGNSFEQARKVLENNTALQLSLLQALATHAPDARTLIVSSAEVYGLSEAGEVPIDESHPLRPINPYAVSKVTQDLLAYSFSISHNLPIIRVRPFNHIGERQTPDFAVPSFAQQISKIERGEQQKLQVGNLSAIRDFTDVKDMVQAYITVMERGKIGEVYNIGTGRGIRMEEVLELLQSLATVTIDIETDMSRVRPQDIPEAVANPSKISALGWSANTPLKETLARILNYWRNLT